MSGSSGGNWIGRLPAGNNNPSNGSNCSSIDVICKVHSPSKEIIIQLSAQQVLEVHIDDIEDIVGVYLEGKLVGGISTSTINEIYQCIENGFGFKATVVSIQDELITVRIKCSQL